MGFEWLEIREIIFWTSSLTIANLTPCEFGHLKRTKPPVLSCEGLIRIDIIESSQCLKLLLCPIVALHRSILALVSSHKAEAYFLEITWTAGQSASA